MTQRRVIAFPNSNIESRTMKLHSIKCGMLPANSLRLPPFAKKAVLLSATAPHLAEVVEELVDQLLAEVS